jgi:hypothetical protein
MSNLPAHFSLPLLHIPVVERILASIPGPPCRIRSIAERLPQEGLTLTTEYTSTFWSARSSHIQR